MITSKKRIERLEMAEQPALSGLQLLAAKWSDLAQKHPVIGLSARKQSTQTSKGPI